MQASCLDVLRALPGGCVDHVITDPPYSEAVHSRSIRCTYRKTRKHAFGFDHLTREQCHAYAREFLRLARRWSMAFSDMENSYWWRNDFGSEYVRTMVYVKERAMPQITGDRPASRTEAIILAHPPGKKRWNKRPEGGDSNVFQYPVVANCPGHRDDRIHTAQKPLDLMIDLVRSFTDHDDVVLDTFAGSGTTGLACHILGRRVILIEQDPSHAATCLESMRATDAQSTVQASRAGQEHLFAASR